MDTNSSSCPLCQHQHAEHFYTQPSGPLQHRQYWRCEQCWLIFVPPQFQLSLEEEKARYDQHQNDANDLGYRKFLQRLVEPLIARLPAQAQGLDFGSGPGPTLSLMLRDEGFGCIDYDIFYAHYPDRLTTTYDFITSTEVIEHVNQPQQVFEQLLACLNPSGILAIMTQRWLSKERFIRWNYRNDPTHICFFHEQTFHWLAKRYQLSIDYISDDVVILIPTNNE